MLKKFLTAYTIGSLVALNLFTLTPTKSLAAASADCPQVLSQAQAHRDKTLAPSVSSYGAETQNWLKSGRGEAPSQRAIAAGNAALSALQTFQSQVISVATKECGEDAFNNLYASLKSSGRSYNTFLESVKDPGGTGGNSAVYQNNKVYELPELTYAGAVDNPTAAQCTNLFSKLPALVSASEQQLILLEQAERVHNNEVLAEYKKNVEPAEIKSTTAWQAANSALQEASRLGCDKSDPDKFKSYRDPLNDQGNRINITRDKLSKARLSTLATVDQTIENVKNIFATCDECEKLEINPIIDKLLQPLCCLLYSFVKSASEASGRLAKQVAEYAAKY